MSQNGHGSGHTWLLIYAEAYAAYNMSTPTDGELYTNKNNNYNSGGRLQIIPLAEETDPPGTSNLRSQTTRGPDTKNYYKTKQTARKRAIDTGSMKDNEVN